MPHGHLGGPGPRGGPPLAARPASGPGRSGQTAGVRGAPRGLQATPSSRLERPEPPPSPGPVAALWRTMSRSAPGARRAKPKTFLEENIVPLGLNLLLQEEPSCHVRD
nr:collagen alpha-1(II) chain-like [Manis javanica]